MNHTPYHSKSVATQDERPSPTGWNANEYSATVKEFEFQRNDGNPEFWRRIGPVDLAGKSVLEIGCGLGALTVDLVERGAKDIVAVDLDEFRIDFARAHLKVAFPEVYERTSFDIIDIADLDGKFDVVVSKDTFEHVADLPGMVENIHRLLRPGGMMVVGFSPLYFSPFGDHGRLLTFRIIPWIPVLLPEAILLKIASVRRGKKVSSMNDLGLNKLTPKQFRKIMKSSQWEAVAFYYNRRIGRLANLFDKMRRVRILEKYFTVNIYAQYRRR